jgi:D-alanyl-D-alanine carboxypeptidase
VASENFEAPLIDAKVFADLGIPQDYARHPRRHIYVEAHELEDVGLNIVGRMQKLAPDTARAWREMTKSAAAAGVELLLVSGFRSIQYQIELFRKKIAAGHAIESILQVNAAPGFSEHHTGKAVDIATPGTRPLTEAFETSSAFAWLQGHAARYGFSMPYGRDNVFGVAYEPWHWSQIGTDPQS